ncbi:MAG: hypothetical protein IPH08_10395 [Rhodocyclaceae bacterium]|nr:hypothetical protein [Rhodocyclaceae bacterium]
MNTATYVAFVGILAIALFLNHGLSAETATAIAVVAALAGIPWYFGTRDKTAPAGLVERLLATLWEWFRRFVGFSIGGLCIWVATRIVFSHGGASGLDHPWLFAAGLGIFGVFLIYFGAVGQGPRRYDWQEDIALHRRNKRRYKWWF